MTSAGAALIRVGQTEQGLGESERQYIRNGHDAIIAPLQRFLEGEMRNIMRERKILENKRLDLDACKNRVRKARAMQMQPPVRDDIWVPLVFFFSSLCVSSVIRRMEWTQERYWTRLESSPTAVACSVPRCSVDATTDVHTLHT